MKRAIVGAGVALAIIAAIVVTQCGGAESTRPAPSTTPQSGSSGVKVARTRDRHVDPRTLQRASIAGSVSDDKRAPIAGARVCADAESSMLSLQTTRDPACTTTGPDGYFTLTNLVAANYVVSAGAKTYRPSVFGDRRNPKFTLAAGEAKQGVDITLRGPGAEITGTVSDVTGGPVAQALVRAGAGDELGPPVETDANGRFSLWVSPGRIYLAASAEGYAGGIADGRAPGSIDILLTPESTLAGIVVDATSGEPVAGVGVVANAGEWSGTGEREPRDITDAQGAFRISRLAPGRYTAVARSPHGFGMAEGSQLVGLGQHVDGVAVKLHAGFQITGKVVLPDKTACREPWVSLTDKTGDRYAETRAEPDGTVVADGVLPGTYQVTAGCRGHDSADSYPAITIVDRDVLDQVWAVTAGATVKGRILTKSGEPVEDAAVWARVVSEAARTRLGWSNDESKQDGSYALSGLRAGKVKIDVSTEKGTAPQDGWTVELTAGATIEKDLILDTGGSISGSVVDADGKAVSGVQVRTQSLTATRGGSGGDKTRSDGTFQLDNVRPGEYRVRAMRSWTSELRKPGSNDDATQGERVTVVAGKTATVKLVVESQTGTITGTVVDAEGKPASDAYISAARESDAAGAQQSSVQQTRWSWNDRPVISSTDGTFTIDKLSPGNYTVRAYRKGGGEAITEHVAVGSTVRLQIKATGSIAGTVRAPAGALEELDVELREPKLGFWRSEHFFRTNGTFTIRDLPQGSFTVTVSAGPGKKQTMIDLGEGEQKTITLSLDALVTITGRVVDLVTKQPVPGVIIIAGVGKDGGSMASRSFDPDQPNTSGTDGRFRLDNAPTGPVTLRGFPRDFRDSEYSGLSIARDIAGSGTVDVGDLPVIKRRVKPGDKVGELGVRFKDPPPGTPLDARTFEVSYIDPKGPATATELKVGDVIISIDGVDITGANSSFAWTLMRAPAGTKLALGLKRGATVTLTLATM